MLESFEWHREQGHIIPDYPDYPDYSGINGTPIDDKAQRDSTRNNVLPPHLRMSVFAVNRGDSDHQLQIDIEIRSILGASIGSRRAFRAEGSFEGKFSRSRTLRESRNG
jgi:hypothetical protein